MRQACQGKMHNISNNLRRSLILSNFHFVVAEITDLSERCGAPELTLGPKLDLRGDPFRSSRRDLGKRAPNGVPESSSISAGETAALCRIIGVLLSVASLREKVHLDGHGHDHWAAALLADLAEPNLSSGNRSCYDIAD